jgi:hypothetical protein
MLPAIHAAHGGDGTPPDLAGTRSHFRWLAGGRASGWERDMVSGGELAQRLDDINRLRWKRDQMVPLAVILVL